MNPAIALDAAIIRALDTSSEDAIFAQLSGLGINFDYRLGRMGFFREDPKSIKVTMDERGRFACDAQPELVTVTNGGIPAWLTNYFDPKQVQTLLSPMRATEIVGSEERKGDWTTTYATFTTVEHTGETSSYGDYSNNGQANTNLNFPQRQSYLYQIFTNWGELQMARAGNARVNWANEVNAASIMSLNKFQNASYFFGISGIPNYGLLNDPNLYAPIAATSAWNAAATDALTVYEDVRRMFVAMQNQSNGVIEMDTPMTLALSPTLAVALQKANQFGLNVRGLLKENFPNLKIVTAVQYTTASGQLVQLIATNVQGQQVATTAYNEKMRAHAVIPAASSWSQKKSQGTFGTVIYLTYAIAQLIGA